MTRFAWFVKISAGLFAACVSGCTHTTGMSIKPAADKTPTAGAVSEAQGPKWPVDPVGGEETQAAAGETPNSPDTIRSPFGTTSLLTTGPELGKTGLLPGPSAADILIAAPLSPAGSRTPPEAMLGAA